MATLREKLREFLVQLKSVTIGYDLLTKVEIKIEKVPEEKVSYLDIIGGNLLFTIGGIVFGFGLANFADPALGTAVSVSGSSMIFGGFYLATRSAVATTRAFNNATGVLNRTNEGLHEIGKMPDRAITNTIEIEKLKRRVADLEAKMNENLDKKVIT
jgi:hypothetical protein